MAAQSSILSSMASAYNSISASSIKRSVVTNATKPTKLDAPIRNSSQSFITNDELRISSLNNVRNPVILQPCSRRSETAAARLYAILEAVADRIEMHTNIGEQRNNWNSLLLNCINMITLTATTMAGLTAAQPVFALKLSAAVLFAAATGLLVVVNKLQPSQLVEEQRNATRLFKQLHEEIQTLLALQNCVTENDVVSMMERVLALDKAYPLPLIGVMLEKFPEELEPAVWWPVNQFKISPNSKPQTTNDESKNSRNGWTDELDDEIRAIVRVLTEKDKEDFIRLGNNALKLNKILSRLGPLLTGAAAIGSVFSDSSSSAGSLAMAVAVGAGALSAVVNSVEHGGQVGMVFEMYRNCAGFYQFMEESIGGSIEESDVNRRENGEVVEMKVALQLGRSLPELKELAMTSALSREDGNAVNEFASKLM